MSFPRTRMRRLRRTETLRRMARETRLSRDDLILPLFVVEGSGVREPVGSMPGVHVWTLLTNVELACWPKPGIMWLGRGSTRSGRR